MLREAITLTPCHAEKPLPLPQQLHLYPTQLPSLQPRPPAAPPTRTNITTPCNDHRPLVVVVAAHLVAPPLPPPPSADVGQMPWQQVVLPPLLRRRGEVSGDLCRAPPNNPPSSPPAGSGPHLPAAESPARNPRPPPSTPHRPHRHLKPLAQKPRPKRMDHKNQLQTPPTPGPPPRTSEHRNCRLPSLPHLRPHPRAPPLLNRRVYLPASR